MSYCHQDDSPSKRRRITSKTCFNAQNSNQISSKLKSEYHTTLPSNFSTRLRKWSEKWEIPRKLLHTSIGFITLYRWIKSNDSPIKLSIWLGKWTSLCVLADLTRFRSKRFSTFYEYFLGFLMRPTEKSNWNGVIFYLVGVIISLSTLPIDISVLSILILSWVDTAASVIGRLFGSQGNRLPSPPFARRKSLAGFLGALVMGTLTSWAFWGTWSGMGLIGRDGYSWKGILNGSSPLNGHRELFDQSSSIFNLLKIIRLPNPDSHLSLTTLSIGCGIISALSESLDLFGWDDNLCLPVLSGWGIWALMKLMG
ncbi:hypothetical protein O181_005212 [Austropuccinia psidii MF-1]|uniref:Phosphatidate cytidylyltransferase n=1 Tax=Austropuccinia psidii MF-1 TaxID=1389203 RepID=A0A9Q3BIB7_9BASI|nr:hypothetical protein [Austropuccinia psidii MF-1]